MRRVLSTLACASALVASLLLSAASVASASTHTSTKQARHAVASEAPGTGASTTGAAAPSGQPTEGQTLFDENCSSCHGIGATGSVLAPSLLGRGAATVDLWVSSGWMPLAVPTAQPTRGPDRFTRAQTIAIANYVSSLRPGGFAIPSVDLAGANAATGQELFAENCAGCHTITGSGDALSGGLDAPTLHGLTSTMIDEAIVTAPGNMPRFYPGALTSAQVNDVVAYVDNYIGHPTNPGGIGLGGDGPVAEGFIGLFIGVGACLLFALWVGDRSEDEESEPETIKEAHV